MSFSSSSLRGRGAARRMSPLAVTQLGDWLLLDDAGNVWLLDTIEAQLQLVARSVA